MPNTTRTDLHQRAENDQQAAVNNRISDLPGQVADAIRNYRAGDRTAMADVVPILTSWLRAVASSVGLSRWSAEDVAQTTILALLNHVDRIRNPDAGLGWLAVTARHEAIRIARSERAFELVADFGTDEGDSVAPGPEAIAMDKLRQALLWHHIANLPIRGQMILHEIAYGDRPDYAGLALRTGMPPGSIGPTRRRSLDKTRRLLESDQDWLAYA